MKTRSLTAIFLIAIFSLFSPSITAQEGHGEKEEHSEASKPVAGHGNEEEVFNASEFIIEHVADSHEWHILTKKNGESVAIYLPVILWSKDKGLSLFSSRKLAHGHVHEGFAIPDEGDFQGKVVSLKPDGTVDAENMPLDFSITKTVVGIFASAFIGLVLFLLLAASYKKTGISHPKGIQSFLEPIILFVRDDIAIPNIGHHKYERYMPYLLTVFFFIIINNLMGLIPFPPPFGANVTGNIAVTFVLAMFTMLITNFSGNKGYWRHIFATPGVPWWLLPVMVPVELIGIISKPFALMIRLFANITAGHIIILSLISLIFIFESVWMAPVSALFVVFMSCLELLVAFLQAYIFTLLSALFISMAMPEEHH